MNARLSCPACESTPWTNHTRDIENKRLFLFPLLLLFLLHFRQMQRWKFFFSALYIQLNALSPLYGRIYGPAALHEGLDVFPRFLLFLPLTFALICIRFTLLKRGANISRDDRVFVPVLSSLWPLDLPIRAHSEGSRNPVNGASTTANEITRRQKVVGWDCDIRSRAAR